MARMEKQMWEGKMDKYGKITQCVNPHLIVLWFIFSTVTPPPLTMVLIQEEVPHTEQFSLHHNGGAT